MITRTDPVIHNNIHLFCCKYTKNVDKYFFYYFLHFGEELIHKEVNGFL